jgi:hypothetical protein
MFFSQPIENVFGEAASIVIGGTEKQNAAHHILLVVFLSVLGFLTKLPSPACGRGAGGEGGMVLLEYTNTVLV